MRGVVELRVHGTGGIDPERLVGEPAVQVAGDARAGFHRREQETDRTIEGYVWGPLTSRGWTRGFWLLLLPFSLINVAGYAIEPRNSWRRWLVWLLGASATASYVAWSFVIVVDLIVHQCGTQLACEERAGVLRLLTALGGRDWGTLLAAVLTAAGIGAALIVPARQTQRRYEDVSLPGVAGDSIDLRDPAAWTGVATRRLLKWHIGAVVVTALVMLGLVYLRLPDQSDASAAPLALGDATLWLGVAQWVLLIALAALSLPRKATTVDLPRFERDEAGPLAGKHVRFRWCGPAVAGFLAAFAIHASFGAIAHATADYLDAEAHEHLLVVRDPDPAPVAVPASNIPAEGAAVYGIEPGSAVLLTDMVPVVAFVAGVAGFFVYRWRRKVPREQPIVASYDAGPVAGRKAWLTQIRAKRGLSDAAAGADWFLTLLALGVVGLAAWLFLSRVDPDGDGLPGIEAKESIFGWDWLRSAGALLLVAFFGAAVWLLRQSTRHERVRRLIGNLWDVLTFFPRRFHPLGPPPYAERAVPELQGRVLELLDDHPGVVIAAHSQGSILSYVALSGLTRMPEHAEKLPRVALATFGSPLTQLYAMAFPAYFANDFDELRTDLWCWTNFWRSTDYIGKRIHLPPSASSAGTANCHTIRPPSLGGRRPGQSALYDRYWRLYEERVTRREARDAQIPDPQWKDLAGPPARVWRWPWPLLACHSYYWNDPILRRWVDERATELAASEP